jgi:AraC-like DNA-binding protein
MMSDNIRRVSDISPSAQRSSDHLDYQSIPRIMTAMARDEGTGNYNAPHSHPRGQLLYATCGLMRAATDKGVWLLPPQKGLWIPAGIVHDQRMLSPTSIRTIYVQPEIAGRLGDACKTIEISLLLKELILALIAEPVEYPQDARNNHIVELILLELVRARTMPLEIPWPKDRRILAICEAIIKMPETPKTIDYWSERVGASPRTLIRLFIKETGQTFRHWVQQVRLAEGLMRLERGDAIGAVANDLGYASPSAFGAMFRRSVGQSPKEYILNKNLF